MRAVLAVPRQSSSKRRSLTVLAARVRYAATVRADLVVFPEAALTGLINNDDPRHDLKLGVTIPGPETRVIATVAGQCRIWVAIGLIERSRGRLYDSAILIDADGRIRLKYRRISAGWHGANIDRKVYGHGRTLRIARTPFGSVVFLICGDLFDGRLVERARRLQPDWVIVPLDRSFEDGSRNQARWDREERASYFARTHRCRAAALLVNSLNRSTGSFGGAWAVTSSGREIASLPLGRPGAVIADLRP